MADAAADKKVFDVAKPGKTAPPSSSKPVIIGHKVMVEDPMVAKASAAPAKKSASKSVSVVAEDDKSEAAETAAPPSSKRITIMPLTHDDEETKPESKLAVKIDPVSESETPLAATPAEPAPEEPASPTPQLIKATEPAAQPDPTPESPKEPDLESTPDPVEVPEETANIPETSNTAAMDAILEQAGNNKKDKDAEADKTRQEALDKLTASKQYYLPIDEAKHIHAVERFLAITLLVALLTVAGVYLAIDAGLIKTNVKLPVELIKN